MTLYTGNVYFAPIMYTKPKGSYDSSYRRLLPSGRALHLAGDDVSYDEVISCVECLPLGTRVRVTWPNGAKRSGEIGRWREYPTLGGKLMGGEYDRALTVEVMNESGRYEYRSGFYAGVAT